LIDVEQKLKLKVFVWAYKLPFMIFSTTELTPWSVFLRIQSLFFVKHSNSLQPV